MQTVWSFISFHFIHLFSHIVKQSLQSNQEILSPSLKISIDALDLTCSDKLFQTVGDAKQKAGLAAFSLQNGNDNILRVFERVVRLCSCILCKTSDRYDGLFTLIAL